MIHVFLNRPEILNDDDGALGERENARQEEEDLVENDRKAGTLFGKSFSVESLEYRLGHIARRLHDAADNVDRCPDCYWELEDGMCAQCDFDLADRLDDYLSDMTGSEESEFDASEMGSRVPHHHHRPSLSPSRNRPHGLVSASLIYDSEFSDSEDDDPETDLDGFVADDDDDLHDAHGSSIGDEGPQSGSDSEVGDTNIIHNENEEEGEEQDDSATEPQPSYVPTGHRSRNTTNLSSAHTSTMRRNRRSAIVVDSSDDEFAGGQINLLSTRPARRRSARTGAEEDNTRSTGSYSSSDTSDDAAGPTNGALASRPARKRRRIVADDEDDDDEDEDGEDEDEDQARNPQRSTSSSISRRRARISSSDLDIVHHPNCIHHPTNQGPTARDTHGNNDAEESDDSVQVVSPEGPRSSANSRRARRGLGPGPPPVALNRFSRSTRPRRAQVLD